MSNLDRSSHWKKTVTADNAAATVTQTAPFSGQTNYITSISGSFSVLQTTGKLMTLKDGATTIGNHHVFDVNNAQFNSPIRMHEEVELSLPASGTAGQIGAVTLHGFTR